MRIAAVDTVRVSLPLERPILTPVHRIESIDCVLVTLRTDEGPEGIAYLWAFGPRRARALAALVDDLAGFVLGEPVAARASLWTRMFGELNFLGQAGAGMFALSAIDTALWDVAAKAAGEPLHRFLGAAARPLPVYAGGLFLSDPIEAIVAEARGYVAAGYPMIKMRVGAADWREDLARVEAVRDAVGPDVGILLDVVQGWTVDRAIRMGRELARFDIVYLEDPVPFHDVAGMARIADALDVPVAAGENDYGRHGFLRLLEAGAVDVAMIDLQRVGGVSEWLRVADLAAAFRRQVVPHVFHEIAVHLAQAAPHVPFLEHVPWWDVLFDAPLAIAHGHAMPPDRPGLGFGFDPDAVDRFRVA